MLDDEYHQVRYAPAVFSGGFCYCQLSIELLRRKSLFLPRLKHPYGYKKQHTGNDWQHSIDQTE
jgi:hypothetical protein